MVRPKCLLTEALLGSVADRITFHTTESLAPGREIRAAQRGKPQPVVADHHPARTLTHHSVQVSRTSRNCPPHGGTFLLKGGYGRLNTATAFQNKFRCFRDCS